MGQRFSKYERLGNKDDFGAVFVPDIALMIGVYEFPYRIEPTIGISYTFKSTKDCLVDNSGNCIPGSAASTDRFRYHLLTLSTGVRWQAWSPEFFILSPYVHGAFAYHYIHFKRNSLGAGKRSINGGDFGGILEGGLNLSFMFQNRTRIEMNTEWGLKDFGMTFSSKWMPGGLWKQGMGDLLETSGWSFGAGLYSDW